MFGGILLESNTEECVGTVNEEWCVWNRYLHLVHVSWLIESSNSF